MTHKIGLLTGGLVVAMLGLSGPVLANAEVEKRAANPSEWGAPGRDNKLTRHSTLNDINTATSASCRWPGRSRPARCAVTKASRYSSTMSAASR